MFDGIYNTTCLLHYLLVLATVGTHTYTCAKSSSYVSGLRYVVLRYGFLPYAWGVYHTAKLPCRYVGMLYRCDDQNVAFLALQTFIRQATRIRRN